MTPRRTARSRGRPVAFVLLGTLLCTTIGSATSRAPIFGPRDAAADDPAPPEDLAAVEAAWKLVERPSLADYRRFLARFRAARGGEGRARELAAALLAKFDPDDEAAHQVLGHKEFALEVPEEISYRRYPFVRIVEEALSKRWFDDLRPYAAALEAYTKCTAHAKRLADDPAYAALDVARRGIDQNEHLHAYNYDAVFASPYLVCYTTKERIDEAALWNMAPEARARAWAELDGRRVGYKRVLAEKARVYTQVYREFLRRYGASCDLKPLMDPFGGRPDYPAGRRSYREGCALIVWVFANEEAWRDYHDSVKREFLASSTLGYHEPQTGLVFTYDHAPEDRAIELAVNSEAASIQLLHWFTRQRNEWGRPWRQQNWFSLGFPAWFGAVTMAKDRSLAFTGVSRRRIEALKQLREQLASDNKKMYVLPLKELVTFEGYGAVQAWGVQNWGVNPALVDRLFDIQTWALVDFLAEGEGGKYRPALDRLVNDMLIAPRGPESYAADKFRREVGIETNDDWKRLQKEFDGFYEALAKTDTDADALGAPPPALDDWPDYVAPDLEAPTGPLPGK